jgi:hypothetical protein
MTHNICYKYLNCYVNFNFNFNFYSFNVKLKNYISATFKLNRIC